MLSEDKRTVSYNITQNMDKLNACTTVKDVQEFLKLCVPKNKMKEPKVKALVDKVNNTKSLQDALSTIMNFVLKGDGLGVISIGRSKKR